MKKNQKRKLHNQQAGKEADKEIAFLITAINDKIRTINFHLRLLQAMEATKK